MEKLELEFNDYVSNIFVFVIKDEAYYYYFSDKSEWLLAGWPYIHNNEATGYIEEALTKLDDDKIIFTTIKKEFERLRNEGKYVVMENHLPMLYIDFDKRILKSRYYEQSLHSSVPEKWEGKFEDFLDIIPGEYQYWAP